MPDLASGRTVYAAHCTPSRPMSANGSHNESRPAPELPPSTALCMSTTVAWTNALISTQYSFSSDQLCTTQLWHSVAAGPGEGEQKRGERERRGGDGDESRR
ncbi:hypothetical protein E4U43_007915 [Claviceps pusilla]|uniref:Uncharacterized protein n=1 Tax=Claviceps pusilla TaxID=123648 RepID=A0A9P7NCQ9_9HYPO|nr:hypothetical protein E4U43_007915 [Claviceps pusilla]